MSDTKKETKATNSNTQKEQTDASNKKVDLAFLEEDDEFEEFEAEDWKDTGKDGIAQSGSGGHNDLWEDNWDDDNIEDDFTTQLRSELEKRAQQTA